MSRPALTQYLHLLPEIERFKFDGFPGEWEQRRGGKCVSGFGVRVRGLAFGFQVAGSEVNVDDSGIRESRLGFRGLQARSTIDLSRRAPRSIAECGD